jgi:pseudouridine-5'-monophosphatase
MDAPAACLFDLDGVLLDTEPLHSEAWLQAARHFSLDLSPPQLLALRGRRRFDCAEQVRHWLADAGQTVPSVDALLAVRQPIAEALLPQAPPMPGAPELVARCQRRSIPMALVTSSSRSAVALKAVPHPWLGTIVLRVHGDDPELVAGKPEPDPYRLAARRLGVEPGRCWAFEDSLAGARSAAAAGCCVHVLLPRDRSAQAPMDLAWPSGSRLLQSLAEIRFDAREHSGVLLNSQDWH